MYKNFKKSKKVKIKSKNQSPSSFSSRCKFSQKAEKKKRTEISKTLVNYYFILWKM